MEYGWIIQPCQTGEFSCSNDKTTGELMSNIKDLYIHVANCIHGENPSLSDTTKKQDTCALKFVFYFPLVKT